MAKPKMNAEQLRWQAESDAETMARYEELMNDNTRRNAAIKMAKKRAADLSASAQTMARAASRGGAKRTSKSKK